jgi:tape measure domain-containing protein
MADEVSIRLRARGGRQAAAEVTGVGKALIGVGRAGQLASRGIGGASRAAGGLGRTMTSWRTAFLVGGLGSLGVAATRMGLQFNASMEQNQVAFTQFLGSTQAARHELGFLYRTAAKTPFEVPQITSAARRLLAFGFNAKQANSWLGTIGDTIAGMGGGAEQIDQLVTAIGQIRSKGRLQGDELMQLSELGVVNRQKLAKDLGITTLELMSGKANVSGTRALRALQKQFDQTFGGQSAKQARTFNGQLSTLHDNLNMTLGTITRPAFKLLERRVFPELGKTSDAINKTFQRKDLDLGQKIHVSEATARRNLGPLVRAGRAEIESLHIGRKLTDDFEKAVPRLADAAGHAAPRVAGAFVRGWWHAGIYGKLFTAGLLLRKLGVFRLAGGLAAQAFLRRYVPTVVAGETAAAAAGAAAGAAAAAAGFFGTRAAAHALGIDDAIHRHQRAARHHENVRTFREQGREPVRLPNGVIVWEKRRDARRERGRQHDEAPVARPRVRRGSRDIHVTLKVGARELAKATKRVDDDNDARR